MLCALFLLYMWVTLFWAKNFNIIDIYTYARRVLYLLGFIAATIYLIHSDPNFLKRLLTLLCWIAGIVSIVYSVYFYLHHPFPQYRLAGYGLLYNPIRTSSIYGIAFLGGVYLLYQYPGTIIRWMHMGILIPLFSYMLLAQARGPIFAIILTLFIWQFIIIFGSGFKNGILGSFSILLLFLLAATIVTFTIFPEFFRYFFIERGLSYRLEIWKNFWEVIKMEPIFGHGLNADTTTIMTDGMTFLHPHSVYVATLYYGGIIGLAIQLILIGYAVFKSLGLKNRPEQFFISCSLFFGAFCIVTDGNILIQHPKPFWIFFWFPVALSGAYELIGKKLNCADG
ncbi:MAG: O-antigen ligase family protein [Desulfobacterales bacterium]